MPANSFSSYFLDQTFILLAWGHWLQFVFNMFCFYQPTINPFHYWCGSGEWFSLCLRSLSFFAKCKAPLLSQDATMCSIPRFYLSVAALKANWAVPGQIYQRLDRSQLGFKFAREAAWILRCPTATRPFPKSMLLCVITACVSFECGGGQVDRLQYASRSAWILDS